MSHWIRVGFEIRHPSWHREEVFDLLERHGVAYRVKERGEPARRAVGHGAVRLRAAPRPGSASPLRRVLPRRRPAWWAERIREWAAQGREPFIDFNNDGHGHAVRKAETLRGMLRC